MRPTKNENPTCEICRVSPAKYFETTREGGPELDASNNWKFLCANCGDETFDYFFEIDDFFSSRDEQADWIFHLSTKTWVNMIEFRGMLLRWVLAGGRKPYPAK